MQTEEETTPPKNNWECFKVRQIFTFPGNEEHFNSEAPIY